MNKLIAAAFAAVIAFAFGAPAQAASQSDTAVVVGSAQVSQAAYHQRHYRRHYRHRHWRR